jgi:hypothetical protein
MLKSRALPDNFDMAQVLHQPYGGRAASGTPLSSPQAHQSPFPSKSDSKPLDPNPIERASGDEYPISPSSATSAYGNYVPSPTSGAPSLNLSPTSTTGNRTPLSAPSASLPGANLPTHGTLPRSHSFSAAYPRAWHPIERLQLQTSEPRSRADSLNSPLRTGLSYTGSTLHENVDSPVSGMAQSLQTPVSQTGPDSASTQSSLIYQSRASCFPFPRTLLVIK